MQIYGIDFNYLKILLKNKCDKFNYYIKELYYNEKFELPYEIIEFFKSKYYNIKKYFRNLLKYHKILKQDEWWDFFYFEDLIIYKLKDLEKHWGVDTHYEGDCFTKKRIQVLLKKWQKIQWYEDEHPVNLKEIENMKIQWFKEFGRLLPRLWD